MSQNGQMLEFGVYRMDAGQRLLFSGQHEIPLPPKVFETLLVLVENQGRILEKDDLIAKNMAGLIRRRRQFGSERLDSAEGAWEEPGRSTVHPDDSQTRLSLHGNRNHAPK